MQILPTQEMSQKSSQANQASAFDTTTGREINGFSQYLRGSLASVPAEITPDLAKNAQNGQNALNNLFEAKISKQLFGFAAQAPYNSTMPSAEGTGMNIRFIPEEITAIADALLEQGVDPDMINELLGLAETPFGASLENIIDAVAQKAPIEMTDTELLEIESLMNRMDPTGGLANVVLTNIRDGNTMQAWAYVSAAIENFDGSFELQANEMLALGKGLGIEEDSMKKVMGAFKGADSLLVNNTSFTALITPMQKELGVKAVAENTLVGKLEAAIMPVLAEAKERLKAEAEAASREPSRVQQQSFLMQDNATKNSFVRTQQQSATGEQAKASSKTQTASQTQGQAQGQTTSQTQVQGQTQSLVQGQVEATDQIEGQILPPTQGQVEDQAEGQVLSQAQVSSQVTAQSQASLARQTTNTTQEQTARLINDPETIETQDKATQSTTLMTDADTDTSSRFGSSEEDFAGNPNNPNDEQASDAKQGVQQVAEVKMPENPWDALLNRISLTQNGGASQSSNMNLSREALAPHVAAQVEQGMLTAMRNGTTKLELQLNPLDLGVINVILTTRNGEVSAMLRPELQETSFLLEQQMVQLKASLEEQGIKVDKVEVQTQLKDEHGHTTWQGTQEHNSAREDQGRSQELKRIQALNKRGGVETDLAQNMQSSTHKAEISDRGLHLVA